MTQQQYSLDEIRLRLNELDDQLLQLLSERRKMSIEVAKSKVHTSKPVRDAEREQQLLVKLINNGLKKSNSMRNTSPNSFMPSLKTLFYFNKRIYKI